MSTRNLWFAGVLLAALLPAACSDRSEPVAPNAAAPKGEAAWLSTRPSVPSPLNTIALPGGSTLTLWPYTADSFPAYHVDPINLVFVGPYSDPRAIRAALLGLGGNRSGATVPLPNFMPGITDCTWQDGIGGGVQAAYVDGLGWQGSAIQLTCGPYAPFRFHLRLFRFGNVTLGGAHFEMNIPGTPNHETLSWLLPRAVVYSDLVTDNRAQIVGVANVGSETPTFRTINPLLYPYVAGMLSALGPLGSTTADMPNDGQAWVLMLGQPPAATPGSYTASTTIDMNIDMPTPFCNPGTFVHVEGPLQLSQTTTITAAGDYRSAFVTKGTVAVTPLSFAGEPFQAQIGEVDAGLLTNALSQATQLNVQAMTPAAPGRGTQTTSFMVGPGSFTEYRLQAHCY